MHGLELLVPAVAIMFLSGIKNCFVVLAVPCPMNDYHKLMLLKRQYNVHRHGHGTDVTCYGYYVSLWYITSFNGFFASWCLLTEQNRILPKTESKRNF